MNFVRRNVISNRVFFISKANCADAIYILLQRIPFDILWTLEVIRVNSIHSISKALKGGVIVLGVVKIDVTELFRYI